MGENTAYYARSSVPNGLVVLCIAPRKYTSTRDWAGATLAINAALKTINYTVKPAFPAFAFDAKNTTEGVAATGEQVLAELLNTAYLIGIGQDTRPNRDAYTVLGFDDVEATGAFNVGNGGFNDAVATETLATFKIHTPSTKARSIVIVITVGGVKIKITIRW